jgi:hypothetical protein
MGKQYELEKKKKKKTVKPEKSVCGHSAIARRDNLATMINIHEGNVFQVNPYK